MGIEWNVWTKKKDKKDGKECVYECVYEYIMEEHIDIVVHLKINADT